MACYAPVYDYRWGCGTKMITDRSILQSSRKFLVVQGKKIEVNHIPKIGDHGIHGGVLQIMRGKRIIVYH
jgi:hypothetical protein